MGTRLMNIYELSNQSITDMSSLGETDVISSDAYFLISQPDDSTNQKFISERVSYGRMMRQVSTDLSVGDTRKMVDEIYGEYVPYLSSVVHVSVSIPDGHAGRPYVMSSMTEYKGVVSVIDGYYLYDGMKQVFGIHNFDSISVTLPISPVFMKGYSSTNELAHRDFVNSSIENAAASYITKVVTSQTNGIVTSSRPFNTYSELSSSTLNQLCKDGKVCGNGSVLDKNDYCYVLSDETHTDTPYGKEGPKTTRYRYTRLSSEQYSKDGWTYMYHVNNSPFTDAQWKSINSGITKEKISKIDEDIQEVDDKIESETNRAQGVEGTIIAAMISSVSTLTENILAEKDGNTLKLSSNAIYSVLSGETPIVSPVLNVETWYFTLSDDNVIPKRVILM